MTHSHVRCALASALLFLSARNGAAQTPNASVAAFGMAGTYLAVAAGYNAVAWNPANLGLDPPAFSMSILSGGGSTGFDPVKLSEFSPFQGKVLPTATKESWLKSIGARTEHGSIDGGLSLIAASVGHVGFQLGLSAAGRANLNQDAAEAILFGNAGRTGTTRDLVFNGSNASGSGFATGAVSLGIPIRRGARGETFSLGVTVKYVRGLGTGRAADNGSEIGSSDVNVQFPVVYTDSANIGNAGSGVGIDVGMAWRNATTTVSATARNVVNSFAWSTPGMRSRAGVFTFDGTTSTTTFDDAPYSSAPSSLRAALEAERFKPELAAGVAHHASSLTLAADAGTRLGDGIELGPTAHVGVGAEFVGIPLLALRGGAAVVSGGYQAAGGVGVRFRAVEIGASMSTRWRNGGQEVGAMVSLISVR